jgi:hypothetical protein
MLDKIQKIGNTPKAKQKIPLVRVSFLMFLPWVLNFNKEKFHA